MNLEELIATLTTAQEMATDVEWTACDFTDGRGVIDVWEDGRVVDSPIEADSLKSAQAIADRHNTAGEVLRHLHELQIKVARLQSVVGHDDRKAGMAVGGKGGGRAE